MKAERKLFFDQLYQRIFIVLLLFITAAAAFNGFYDKWHFRESVSDQFYPPVSFQSMVDGTADRPFVYRQLLPTLANWIDASIPTSVKERFVTLQGDHSKNNLSRMIHSSLVNDPNYGLRYLIVYVLNFAFTFFAAIALYLAARASGHTRTVALISSITLVLLMPILLTVGGYFYDLPELAFLAFTFWIVNRFNWWWVIPVILLATFNKESFLLSIPSLYPLLRERHPRRYALLSTGLLGLASLSVYLYLHHHFQFNSGGSTEWHLKEQLGYFHQYYRFIFDYDITYGLILFSASSPFFLALIAWSIYRAWPLLKANFRRYILISFLIDLPLYFLFCKPREMRNFSLTFVGLMLIFAANIKTFTHEDAGAEIIST